MPSDDASRSALVQNVCASFCREFVGALVEKRADVKTGRKIKDAFNALQAQLKAVQPFDQSEFSDEYLLDAVDCEGNHPPSPSPHRAARAHDHAPGEEAAAQAAPAVPLLPLRRARGAAQPASAFCTKGSLALPPNLQAKMREQVEALLDRERQLTLTKLDELVSMEEAYVYTDDPESWPSLPVPSRS